MEGDQILGTGDGRPLVTGGREKEGHGEIGRRRHPVHLPLTRRGRNGGRTARNDEKERNGKGKRRNARRRKPWFLSGANTESYLRLSTRCRLVVSPFVHQRFSIFSKGPEFHTWLVEERKINPETISKDQSKKEFVRFVEDFNTATLPHEKYYNMEAYERRMSALRSGEFVPPSDDMYDPQADMKAISGAHKKKLVERESYMSREQLMELRKVQNERIEAGKMKLLGMDIKQNMGVRMDGTAFE
ncbi:uncharacterized protein EV420DRAFT_310193 [Desarmillaria tabescens]|uniref:Uncharacterized protein n=1 Tax=Armillaria tabescens TaxID=1929756 RepID=A0AA39KGB9_ARMTA|nr:uncharacterized protein EV420DRAFT_310193 [Desarmillaria tabescens]KAK0459234.1 hypothetical protein EV420DRAFT_310193 [Desarmillaria tabescens]